jgi:hypothetical protein
MIFYQLLPFCLGHNIISVITVIQFKGSRFSYYLRVLIKFEGKKLDYSDLFHAISSCRFHVLAHLPCCYFDLDSIEVITFACYLGNWLIRVIWHLNVVCFEHSFISITSLHFDLQRL